MTEPAPILTPPASHYRGALTDPARWSSWTPRRGDVLVCTPPKCGTTWTQAILSMLLAGTTDLPAPVPVLSPWVDADLGVSSEEVGARLAAQTGRRVVKTHTPADGFPVWQEVRLIAVYRHPLDMFLSLRRHIANRTTAEPDHPMLRPVPEALRHFLEEPADPEDFDRDNLETVVLHYRETALSGRYPGAAVFHYADMLRDGRAAVALLAEAAGIAATDDLIDAVAEATGFARMKADAGNYTPVAGTGFFRSDAGFFASGTSGGWREQLSAADIARYDARLAALLPEAGARAWLEAGAG